MFGALTKFELKLQLRNFFTVFFALVYPVMMLLLFGAMYGNEPNELMGGLGTVDVMIPAYICMIVSVTGLMSQPLTLAAYREQKILKRFRATPLQPTQILLAQLLVNGITTLAGMSLLLVVATIGFKLQFSGNIPETVLAFFIVLLSVFSLGLMIAGVAKNGKAATAISYLVYFPMLFLSGASIPLQIMPASVTTLAKVFPLSYGVNLLSGVWSGGHLWNHSIELAVLLGTTLLFGAIAARFFKWE